MTYPVGRVLQGYRVIETFKRGSTSWYGYAEKGGAQYQVKVLCTPSYPHNGARGSEASKAEKRRVFEAAVEGWKRKLDLMRAFDHEHIIVPITDMFRVPGPEGAADHIALASPRVQLANCEHSTLPPEDRVLFMKAAAYGLAELHERRLVHSDIKAGNLPVYRAGRYSVKILDFDNSYIAGEPPPFDEYIADQRYAAPEAVAYMNEEAGPEVLGTHVDVFSLGVLFAEIWAGPWPTSGVGVAQYPCQTVSSGRFDVGKWIREAGGISTGIADVIDGMLRVDYRARPTSAEVFRSLGNPRENADRSGAPGGILHLGPGFGARVKGGEVAAPKAPAARGSIRMKTPDGRDL